jgi:hypothetical protein
VFSVIDLNDTTRKRRQGGDVRQPTLLIHEEYVTAFAVEEGVGADHPVIITAHIFAVNLSSRSIAVIAKTGRRRTVRLRGKRRGAAKPTSCRQEW